MLKNIRRKLTKSWHKLIGVHARYYPDYTGDGLGVHGRNLGFMDDPAFDAAWREIFEINKPYWGRVPDVRWRMHVCVWAARHALHLDGDFVECGVNTGLFSAMICKLTAAGRTPGRKFYLFDTYAGIPADSLPASERDLAAHRNRTMYTYDAYEVASRIFAPYPNVTLVRGILPGSLNDVPLARIAYLSMDLNVASAELATGAALWDRLVPGGVIVLDDYAFTGHDDQYAGWNAFAAARQVAILTLPTGQGLLIKPV